MKKIYSIILVLTFIFALSGCQLQSTNKDISSQIYKASEQSLKITDDFLNYKITKETAVTQLEDIYNRLGDNLTDDEDTCRSCIHILIYYIDGDRTYNQIVIERNDLAEYIGKGLLPEPDLTLNETVKSEDGVYFDISSSWKQEDETSFRYKTSNDINISLTKHILTENETAESFIQKQIDSYKNVEKSHVFTNETNVNGETGYIIEYIFFDGYHYYEKTLLFHHNNTVQCLSVYTEEYDSKRCNKIFEQVVRSLKFE